MTGGVRHELRGVVPVVVTPFAEDGSVDVGQFERQIEFLLAGGVQWVGLGYGSEAPRLRQDELSDLTSRIVACRAGLITDVDTIVDQIGLWDLLDKCR